MLDAKTDLNQLVIFAKVVETQSFTAAGRALGLPKSTVSRKVAQLEERLGVVLLERTTRKLSLTDVGAAFHERCARISLEIDEAELAVTRTVLEPRGRLRIAAPAELACGWLAEAVREFLLTHPEIEVELELSDRFVDLLEEGYDLAVRVGPVPDSSVITRELGQLRRIWVASPGYLQRRGIPERLEDLEHHDLLLLGNARRAPVLDGVTARPRLLINDATTLRSAVMGGVGIAMLPYFACREELERGTLRSCLPEWTHREAISALYPTSRHLSAKVRVFVDRLVEQLDPPGRSTPSNASVKPVHASHIDA